MLLMSILRDLIFLQTCEAEMQKKKRKNVKGKGERKINLNPDSTGGCAPCSGHVRDGQPAFVPGLISSQCLVT